MVYRLSFVLWRVRIVMQLLVTYFLWWAIFSQHETLFGYTQSMMLTYILLSAVVRPFVMGTRTQEVGMMINDGSLSNYLTRPINLFRLFWSRDIADKSLNIIFAIGEIAILILLLKPSIILQANITVLLFTFLALVIGVVLFFYFSMLLSLLGFWTSEIWGPRFLSFILVEFFGGMLFPLDILPESLFRVSTLLPFSYFIYFPLKVYLGQLSVISMISGLGVGLVWALGLKLLTELLRRRGLMVYSSEGK